MAKASQKDILSRVQDLGEEALHKLSEVPGGSRLVDMANQTKSRLDDMQKRIRGLEKLEQRVAKLEEQVASLAKTSSARKASPAWKVLPDAEKAAYLLEHQTLADRTWTIEERNKGEKRDAFIRRILLGEVVETDETERKPATPKKPPA